MSFVDWCSKLVESRSNWCTNYPRKVEKIDKIDAIFFVCTLLQMSLTGLTAWSKEKEEKVCLQFLLRP